MKAKRFLSLILCVLLTLTLLPPVKAEAEGTTYTVEDLEGWDEIFKDSVIIADFRRLPLILC